MLFFEVKKIFSKTVNKVAILFLMASLIVISYWTIRDVEYLQENGQTMEHGITAARHLKEETKRWSGNLTEEVLQSIIDENIAINATKEALSDDYRENDKAYAKKQGYEDIRYLINKGFADFEAEYDYNRIDTISVEQVGRLYEQRTANLKEWLNREEVSNIYSKQEKQFLISKYESLKTPLYYEYCEGWKALLASQYLPTFLIIVILTIGFLISGIFSDEFSLKADSILFSTKLGRGKAVWAKIGAGVLVITAIYWGIMFLYSLVVLGALGGDGAECALQICVWDTLYNINLGQYYWLVMFAGYVGCLFILNAAMLISAKTRSAVLAIAVTFFLTCVTPFLGRIPVLKNIMESFPEMLLRMNTLMDEISLYQIGNKVFRSFELMMPGYLLLAVAIVPVLYVVYRRVEVG